MASEWKKQWVEAELHLSGATCRRLIRRYGYASPREVARDLSSGQEIPTGQALRVLGRTEERSKEGDLWIRVGQDLYLLAPAVWGDRPWTVIEIYEVPERDLAALGVAP